MRTNLIRLASLIGVLAVIVCTVPAWASSRFCSSHFPAREPIDTPYSDGWTVEKQYRLTQMREGRELVYLLEELRPREQSGGKVWRAMGRFTVLQEGREIFSSWGFDPPSSERGFNPPLQEAYGFIMFSVDSGGAHCCSTMGIWSGSSTPELIWVKTGESSANVQDLNRNNFPEVRVYDPDGMGSARNHHAIAFLQIVEFVGGYPADCVQLKGREFEALFLDHARRMQEEFDHTLNEHNMNDAEAAAKAWLAAVESTEDPAQITEAVERFLLNDRFPQPSKYGVFKELADRGYPLLQKESKVKLSKGQASDLVSHDGDTLHLRLKSGSLLALQDKPQCDGFENCLQYEFIEYWPVQGYYLIHVQYYEGDNWIVVNDRTGQQTFIQSGPHLSPDETRFVSVSASEAYNLNGVWIWRFETEGLQAEFSHEPKEYALYTFIEWSDKDTISLKKFTRADPEVCPFSKFMEIPVILKRTPSQWEAQEDRRKNKVTCDPPG